MSALARLLRSVRRAHLVRLARERRIQRLRADLTFIERTIESCYPTRSTVIAQRQQLVRRLDAYEGDGTRFGGLA